MNNPLPTNDGSFTLLSTRYGQTYHSTNGAHTEAHHVYLEASGVADRLRKGQKTRILEVGFGLGLNALLTADLAVRHGTVLEYHAFEHDLVAPELIAELDYQSLLNNPWLLDSLCDAVTKANNGESTTHHLSKEVVLTLHLGDVTTANIAQRCGTDFQAVYLDAFSPDTNAECWSAGFIGQLADVMADNGQLSTYSAKGAVRRAMQSAGLKVNKLPGPPGKREMLVAQTMR